MNVEPRKYRFRFLNSAVSRSFALYFALTSTPNGKLPFKVIASDSGLLGHPVQVSDMVGDILLPLTVSQVLTSFATQYISMAERYEIVFDFTNYAGQAIELRNLAKVGGIGVDDDYENTDKVMRFIVSSDPVEDTSTVPATLRDVPFPPPKEGIDHHFRFHRSNGQWMINNVGFADVENRVLANVPRGTVEIWELENRSDGWSHPIHVHLVDFKVLSRTGNRAVMPYEAEGLKDVVWLGRGETVTVEAHYAPVCIDLSSSSALEMLTYQTPKWDGVYMFHCHNLIHEDHDMMAAFNVTALPDFGYNETAYIDPMEERWRAKPYQLADLRAHTGVFSDQAITERVEFMASFDPYSHVNEISDALDQYWETHSPVKARDSEHNARPIPRYRRFVV